MIRKPLTSPFRVALARDLYACGLGAEPLRAYLLDRDLSRVELARLQDQPTIFHCEPLSEAGRRLWSGDPCGADVCWWIFSSHVSRIENLGFEVAYEVDRDGTRTISASHWKAGDFGLSDIREVVTAIVERANGAGVGCAPFSQPDTWSPTVAIRSALLRARAQEAAPPAPTGATVSETISN